MIARVRLGNIRCYSVFEVMKNEGLTSLKIVNDITTNEVKMSGWRREWDEGVDWARYSSDFVVHDLPFSDEAEYLGNDEIINIFSDSSSSNSNHEEIMNEVISLIQVGKHREMNFFHHKFESEEVGVLGNLHSFTRGIGNRSNSLFTCPVRWKDYDFDFMQLVKDGLNLSRAMSFKTYAAQIPYGGASITLQNLGTRNLEATEIKYDDNNNMIEFDDFLQQIGFLSFCIDCLRVVAAPGVGFPRSIPISMNKYFTPNIVGGGWRETGVPTALGVYWSIKEVCDYLYGTGKSLKDKSIAIQGLGVTGSELLRLVMEEKMFTPNSSPVYISDIDPMRVSKALDEYAPSSPEGKDVVVVVVDPYGDDILGIEDCDIFAPCACSGIISEDNVELLNFDIVMGTANNSLLASSQSEEIELARRLMDERGVLYSMDWVHNGGGIACVVEEYNNPKNPSYENLCEKLMKISYETRKVMEDAEKLGISPTELAYRNAEKAIYNL